ncbi:MAG: pseudouridine synthase [Cytophagales bacterium]|nr:pseudouridine synthase [Cytophagales bacterium]
MKRIQFKDLVLFENEDYAVINKPPFISTLEDRHMSYNILSMAKEVYDDPQVCHRLDKDTSGALVIAKHQEAYRHLAIQFEKRKVEKVYHAISEGLHEFKDKTCQLPILQLKKGIVKIDFREGKAAETVFNTIEGYKHHTLVEARPRTGRMHQIRIHLSSLKAPIVSDEKYGGQPFFLSKIKRKYAAGKYGEEQPLIKRFALHARRIDFLGLDGQPLSIEAPYPKDFQVLVKQLEKNRY